ncbi:hypothetical protein F4802DRAFT_584123 [Xylaria palmicola]|nr:hypothetical protein F4802DRAFT_584123 [Xylaria palmicola]
MMATCSVFSAVFAWLIHIASTHRVRGPASCLYAISAAYRFSLIRRSWPSNKIPLVALGYSPQEYEIASYLQSASNL